MSYKFPTYFISHGGGPWPWMPQMRSNFKKLEQSLVDMVANLRETPKAILMVSGHWEEKDAKIMSSQNPPMVYDYYGFPKETYEIEYKAPGSPEYAAKLQKLLNEVDIEAQLDDQRGFDHGTFAPLEIMFPDADVPVFQLSILSDYDPVKHFEMGRALSALREEGVMIVGSGLSYHNLRLMGKAAQKPSKAFDDWLFETLNAAPNERTQRLMNWVQAPSARVAHPEEDHLVPLFVALGAAEGDQASRIYYEDDFMGGVTASSYQFG